MSGAKSSKKQRKVGRNANYCLRYKNENRQEKNKLKKLLKHLIRFPDDNIGCKASIGIK